MADEIANARTAAANGEQSLGTWVRRRGGMSRDRGDIRGADPRGRGASAVISDSGRSADDLAVAAWEDGFFPGDSPPTARQFMDALDADLRQPGRITRPEADASLSRQAREILDYYERQGIDTARRGSALERQLRDFIGVADGNSGQPATLRDLRELRRIIRQSQRRAPIGPDTVDNAALQRLEGALTDDIYAAAGGMADDLRRADTYYRRMMGRIENVRRIINPDDPSQTVQGVLRAAAPRTENTRMLAQLRAFLPDDEWRVFSASLIDEMGAPQAGAAGFEVEQAFSIANFARAYRAMTPRARAILFGSRGGQGGQSARTMSTLADDLDNLAEIANSMKAVSRGANSSGSATHLQNIFSIGGVLTQPQNVIPAVIGGLLTGEMLTNPAFVRWLVSARGGPGMRQSLSVLQTIAARDPAIGPIVARLEEASQAQQSEPAPSSAQNPARTPQPAEAPLQ